MTDNKAFAKHIFEQGEEFLANYLRNLEDATTEDERADKDTIAAQADQIKRLKEALEPFSIESKTWGSLALNSEYPLIKREGDDEDSTACFTVGDLRRAAALLAELNQ